MFSDNKKSKGESNQSSIQNVISNGTKIVGTFESQADIRVDGIIEGDVITPGKVVVGKTGAIHGNLEAANAYFEGELVGKLKLTGTLTLKPTAKIEGDVIIEKLAIEPGAIFNVSCEMKTSVKDIKGGAKNKKTA